MYENYCKNCGFILFPLKELEAEQKEHQENNQFYLALFLQVVKRQYFDRYNYEITQCFGNYSEIL